MGYYDKKQARIDRYRELADNAKERSDRAYEASRRATEHIPMGQPILVGHHSEKHHRRDLDRSWTQMEKGHDEADKAAYWNGKAIAAENNTAISSDNPDALELLRKKLAQLEDKQEKMKAVNKVLRSKNTSDAEKVEQLVGLGIREKSAVKLLEPDDYGRLGFPAWALSNNNGNMRNVRQRIKDLEAREGEETTEIEINGVTIRHDVEENRVQIFFSDKPDEEVRNELKQNSFKWSRYHGCWQRQLNPHNTAKARSIVQKFYA